MPGWLKMIGALSLLAEAGALVALLWRPRQDAGARTAPRRRA